MKNLNVVMESDVGVHYLVQHSRAKHLFYVSKSNSIAKMVTFEIFGLLSMLCFWTKFCIVATKKFPFDSVQFYFYVGKF
jgi:hypothetical protein